MKSPSHGSTLIVIENVSSAVSYEFFVDFILSSKMYGVVKSVSTNLLFQASASFVDIKEEVSIESYPSIVKSTIRSSSIAGAVCGVNVGCVSVYIAGQRVESVSELMDISSNS